MLHNVEGPRAIGQTLLLMVESSSDTNFPLCKLFQVLNFKSQGISNAEKLHLTKQLYVLLE